jgi:hypothetical protein
MRSNTVGKLVAYGTSALVLLEDWWLTTQCAASDAVSDQIKYRRRVCKYRVSKLLQQMCSDIVSIQIKHSRCVCKYTVSCYSTMCSDIVSIQIKHSRCVCKYRVS